ncbi:hypothetical protein ACFVTP_20215 [Streptomyces celluloflavus]|uniref:hypothetical protein n=1 Tax=Streptomyces celluloflavus TaxID=58344 RepID=UPI0036D91BFB
MRARIAHMVSAAGRGPGPNGAVRPHTCHSPDLVGRYADGPRPGVTGVAVLTGRLGAGSGSGGGSDTGTGSGTGSDTGIGTDTGSGAWRSGSNDLTGIKPGTRVDARRSGGSTAQFTVEDVETAHPVGG